MSDSADGHFSGESRRPQIRKSVINAAEISLASFLSNMCKDLVDIENSFPGAFVQDEVIKTNLNLDLEFLKNGPIFFSCAKTNEDKLLFLHVI
jgi:hypothetical protein